MADSKYIDLIAKYLSGNISTPEQTELLQWAESSQDNQKFFEEMVQLWSIAGAYEDDAFEADTSAAWNQLDKRIDDGTRPAASGGSARIIPLSMRSILRVAAATLLLIAASYGVYTAWVGNISNQPVLVSEETSTDETREITLPDGTQIVLNENSRLSYLDDFTERTVEMTGEAYFDVAHRENSPFIIVTGEVETTVLGTAFNLRAYPDEEKVEVTVQRGKVRLSQKETEDATQSDVSVTLEEGNTGVFDLKEHKAVKFEEQLINADAWKTGILNLDGLRMEQVITVLQRYYDVRIDVEKESIMNCSVTNLYFENEPLDTVLAGLKFVLRLDVEQPSDSVLVFTGEGCSR